VKGFLSLIVLSFLCCNVVSAKCVEGNCSNGQGTYIFSIPSKYVVEYKDGKKHEEITGTATGNKYVGEFKDGKMHGQGTYTWSDGDKYVGEFKDDKRHGQGTYTWSDGDKYVGEHKDNKRHGQGTYTRSSGNKFVGEYKDGLQSRGIEEFKNDDGTKSYWVGTYEKVNNPYKGYWKIELKDGGFSTSYSEYDNDKEIKNYPITIDDFNKALEYIKLDVELPFDFSKNYLAKKNNAQIAKAEPSQTQKAAKIITGICVSPSYGKEYERITITKNTDVSICNGHYIDKEFDNKIFKFFQSKYKVDSLINPISVNKNELRPYFDSIKLKESKQTQIAKAEPSQTQLDNYLLIFNENFSNLKKNWNNFEKDYLKNQKLAETTYSSIDKDNLKFQSLAQKLDASIKIVFNQNKFSLLKKDFSDLETINKSASSNLKQLDFESINAQMSSIDNKIISINSFIDENIVKLINEVELLKDQSLKEKIKDILFAIGAVVVCLVLAGILFFSLRKMDLSNLKSQSVHVSKSLNTFNSNTLNIIRQMLEKLMIISKRNTSIVVAVSVVVVVFALQSFTAINLNPFAKDEYANIDPSTLSKDEKNAYTCVKIYNFKKGSEQFRKCIFDINQQEIEKRKVEVNKKLAEEKLARTKVEEADLEKSKKYDNVNFNNLSDEEKIAYTCVKTYGFKVGSPTFQKCINKITEGELELKRIEIERKVAEAQLLTAKANKEAALAKAEAARAQGEIQKAQVEAARAAAEASNQQAAAAQARIKAERFRNSMSLIESGLRGLQPQPRRNNTTTLMPQTQRCTIQGFGTFAKMVCR
jgi:hypothetical protein